MNAEKLKRLQAQVRIGGKGTPRRKKKVTHQTAATDDKKLQSSLKKLSVSTIPGIEEVNIIKDDLTVINFNNPKAQASLSANTFAVTGHGETKKVVEMLPEILPQLGQETVVQLRKFANLTSTTGHSQNQKPPNSTPEDADEVPLLVDDFDEIAKQEASQEFSSKSNARSSKNKNANNNRHEDKKNVDKLSKPNEKSEANEEVENPKTPENKMNIEIEKSVENKEILKEEVLKAQAPSTLKNKTQNKDTKKYTKSVTGSNKEEKKEEIKKDIQSKVVQEGELKQISNQPDKKKQQDKPKKTSQSQSIKGTQQPNARPLILDNNKISTVAETGTTNNDIEKKEVNEIHDNTKKDETICNAPQKDMNTETGLQILRDETKASMSSPEIKEIRGDIGKPEDEHLNQQQQNSENINSNPEEVKIKSEKENVITDIALPIQPIVPPQQKDHNTSAAVPNLDSISQEFKDKPDLGTLKSPKKLDEVAITVENNAIQSQECLSQPKPTINAAKMKDQELNVSNNAKNISGPLAPPGRSQKKPNTTPLKMQSAVISQSNQKQNAIKQATTKNQGTQENKLDSKKPTPKIDIKKDNDTGNSGIGKNQSTQERQTQIAPVISGDITKQPTSNISTAKNPPTQQRQAQTGPVISGDITKQPTSNSSAAKNPPTQQRQAQTGPVISADITKQPARISSATKNPPTQQAETAPVGAQTPQKLNEKQTTPSNTTRSAKPAVSAIKKQSVASNTKPGNIATNSNNKMAPSSNKPKAPNPQVPQKLGNVSASSTTRPQPPKDSQNQAIILKADTKSAPLPPKSNEQQ